MVSSILLVILIFTSLSFFRWSARQFGGDWNRRDPPSPHVFLTLPPNQTHTPTTQGAQSTPGAFPCLNIDCSITWFSPRPPGSQPRVAMTSQTTSLPKVTFHFPLSLFTFTLNEFHFSQTASLPKVAFHFQLSLSLDAFTFIQPTYYQKLFLLSVLALHFHFRLSPIEQLFNCLMGDFSVWAGFNRIELVQIRHLVIANDRF